MSVPFPDVLGHDYARQGLWRAMSEGRLHHAILLHGLRGVGKRTLALSVARALLCETGGPRACGACLHCQKAEKGVHPDLAVLGREDLTGIDPGLSEAWKDDQTNAVRMLKVKTMTRAGEWLLQLPFEASRRVLVIVDAHEMNPTAANKFLKSLEEPAAGNITLLTSSAAKFLLPTIRSRCAAIRLTGVPQGLIEQRLREAGLDAEEARVRAQASGGSLAKALATRPPLDELRQLILARFLGGPRADVAAFAAATEAGSADVDRADALHLFATLLRDIAVLRNGGDAGSLLHTAVADHLARVASGPIDTDRLFAKVVEARARMAGQANRVILWDDLLHDAASGA